MEKFRQYINQFTPINDLDWKEIQPYLNLKQVKKGEMILKEGQVYLL